VTAESVPDRIWSVRAFSLVLDLSHICPEMQDICGIDGLYAHSLSLSLSIHIYIYILYIYIVCVCVGGCILYT